jgi:2,4-dienoyl-CoA reductase-like NADH-dependent reductase (Old Yellow Enzyme family)
MTIDLLDQPLTLPCGVRLPNRLAKAALSEGLATPENHASERHVRLYRRWSEGGAGLLITGNVMVHRRHLDRPGNVVIDGNEDRAALKAWAVAGSSGGNALWMQINHAGRQSKKAFNPQPMAPSAMPMALGGSFADPRAMT